MLFEEITDQILGAFYKVYNELGYGFLEKVYEGAMEIELQKMGLEVVRQQKIPVYYHGANVGDYYADLVVERKVIVELKATKTITKEHTLQLSNYLKATDAQVGLVLCFGSKPTIVRRLFTNDLKVHRPKLPTQIDDKTVDPNHPSNP